MEDRGKLRASSRGRSEEDAEESSGLGKSIDCVVVSQHFANTKQILLQC